ncbi:MAG: S-layer homology domain-containing protein [Bacillota bacterium]
MPANNYKKKMIECKFVAMILAVLLLLGTISPSLAFSPPPDTVNYADEFALMYQLVKIATTTNSSQEAAAALANYGIGKLADLNPTTAWLKWAAETGEYAGNALNDWHVRQALNSYMAARRGDSKFLGIRLYDGSPDLNSFPQGNVVLGLAELFSGGQGRDVHVEKYVKAVVKGDVNYKGPLTNDDFLRAFRAMEVGYQLHAAVERAKKEEKEEEKEPLDEGLGNLIGTETLADGALKWSYDSGVEVFLNSSGVMTYHYPDGSIYVRQPDGQTFTIPPSEEKQEHAETGSSQNLPRHNNAFPDDNASASTGITRTMSTHNAWLRLAAAKDNAIAFNLLSYSAPGWDGEELARYREAVTDADAWYHAYRGARYFYHDASNFTKYMSTEAAGFETVEIVVDVPGLPTEPIAFKPLSTADTVRLAREQPAHFAALAALPLSEVNTIRFVPDIAVLRRGYYAEAVALLSELGEPVTLVDEFAGQDELSAFPVLVLPTAALSGLGSAWFRGKLEEYAARGGIIISFTQQRGADFRALPGGDIRGYGYDEDDLCQFASSYFGEYQSLLSGQVEARPDFNVDGFFTAWPPEATVLLNRVKNQQPVALLYGHGAGYVIATAFYSDWARNNHQVTPHERAWLRDTLAWARFPAGRELEFKNGDSVEVRVLLQNWSFEEAAWVEFAVIGPDGKEMPAAYLDEPVRQLTGLAPGEERELSLTYLVPPNNDLYGFYLVDYYLKDSEGEIIQKSFGKAAFTVSRFKTNPAGFSHAESDLTVSVTSSTETYFQYDTGSFTITVHNSSAQAREAEVRYVFSSHEYAFLLPGHNPEEWRGSRSITVPPRSSYDFEVATPPLHLNESLLVDVDYDGGAKRAFSMRRFWVQEADFTAAGSLSKSEYEPGESVRLLVSLDSSSVQEMPAEIFVRPSRRGRPLFEAQANFSAAPGGFENILDLEPALDQGDYFLDVFVRGRQVIEGLAFRVRRDLQFDVTLPESNLFYAGGSVPVGVAVRNTGTAAKTGALSAMIRGVSGASAGQILEIAAGDDLVFNLQVPLPSGMRAGQYELEVSFATAAGLQFMHKEALYLADAAVALGLPAGAAGAGEVLTVPVTNEGGSRLESVPWSLLLQDGDGEILIQNSGSISLDVGETGGLDLQLPTELRSGRYVLKAYTSRESRTYLVDITGITSLLELALADLYQEVSNEEIIITARITNTSGVDLNDGTLFISVQQAGEKRQGASAVQPEAVRAVFPAVHDTLFVLQDGSAGPEVRRYDVTPAGENLEMEAAWTVPLAGSLETVTSAVYQLAANGQYVYGLTTDGDGFTRLHVLSCENGARLASATLAGVANPSGLGLAAGHLFVLGEDAFGSNYLYAFAVTGVTDGALLAPEASMTLEGYGGEVMISGYANSLYLLCRQGTGDSYQILPYGVSAGAGGVQLMPEGVIDVNAPVVPPLEGFFAIPGGGFSLWASEWTYLQLNAGGSMIYGMGLGYGYLPVAAAVLADAAGYEHRTVVFRMPPDDPYFPGKHVLLLDVVPPGGYYWEDIVYQHEVSLSLAAGASRELIFSLGSSPQDLGAGGYEVFASLHTHGGKKLADAYRTFTVASSSGYITLATAGRHCRSGEPVPVHITVTNPSSQPQDVTVELAVNRETADIRTLVVPAGEQVTYTVTVAAPQDSFTLRAATGAMTVYKEMEVVQPEAALSILAPSYFALGQALRLEAVVQNTGLVPFSGLLQLSRQADGFPPVSVYNTQVSLDPSEIGQYDITDIIGAGAGWQYLLVLKEGDTVLAQAGETLSSGNQVAVWAELDNTYHPEGVSFPVYVTNSGSLPVNGMNLTLHLTGPDGYTGALFFQVPAVREKVDGEEGRVWLEAVLAELEPGEYTVAAASPHLEDAVSLGTFRVLSLEPQWSLEALPPTLVTAGQEAVVTFRVRNTGLVPAAVNITPLFGSSGAGTVKSADVSAGTTADIEVSFPIPDDLPAGEAVFRFQVNDRLIVLPLPVEGLDLAVTAALDKDWYGPGDNVTLTITVSNLSSFAGSLLARANLGDHSRVEGFSLAAGGVAHIPVVLPLDGITGEQKLMFGIYHESGRSLYINDYYLPLAGEIISLKTHRQYYQMGEDLVILVKAREPGVLRLQKPHHAWLSVPEEDIAITGGDSSLTFVLPAELKTGAYRLPYTFEFEGGTIQGALYVDVFGYRVTVEEAERDQPVYGTGDRVDLVLSVLVEREIAKPVELHWSLLDERGRTVKSGTGSIPGGLPAGRNTLYLTAELAGISGGSYLLHYSLVTDLADHSPVALVSGSTVLEVTDTSPPAVVRTMPRNGDSGVGADTVIVVTFDEPVNTATVESGWQLNGLTGGTFLWPKPEEFIFIPSKKLPAGQYTVRLSGVTDSAGNVMADYSFSFRVGSTPGGTTGPAGGAPSAGGASVSEADGFTVLILPAGPGGVTVTLNNLRDLLKQNITAILISWGGDAGTVTFDSAAVKAAADYGSGIGILAGEVKLVIPPVALPAGGVTIGISPLDSTATGQMTAAVKSSNPGVDVPGRIYKLSVTTDDGQEVETARLYITTGRPDNSPEGCFVAFMDGDGTLEIPLVNEIMQSAAGVVYGFWADISRFGQYAVISLHNPFSDIAGHWAQREILLLSARGIIRGMGDGCFKPQSAVTRAQFAALLLRALGLEEYRGGVGSFSDLPSRHWSFGAVEAAFRAGLVRGTGTGHFEPEREITRQEMAVMVARALELAGSDFAFKLDVDLLARYEDAASTAEWARDGLALCLDLGIIRGRSKSHLWPLAATTRAESVVILKRILERAGNR